MNNIRGTASKLILSLLLLLPLGGMQPGLYTQQSNGYTLYIPLVFNHYPCYSVETITIGDATEYRFKCYKYHFMTLINENGTLNLRPHPGRDVNGWGSSWYAQPFLVGAILKNTVIQSVVAYPDRIHLSASGLVSRGNSSSYGSWNISLDFTFNSAEMMVTGTGVYSVFLAGGLTNETGDLNLYKIASNFLDNVPLLDGTIGDTGDMASVTVTLNDSLTFIWTPPSDHCPADHANKVVISILGQYNNVDTAAMGYPPIEPAYKPSMTVVLWSTQPISPGIIFCGLYDDSKSRDFWEDNVGVHAIIPHETIQTEFNFNVQFESQPIPGECSLPSICSDPFTGSIP